jgi:hypothetical protein
LKIRKRVLIDHMLIKKPLSIDFCWRILFLCGFCGNRRQLDGKFCRSTRFCLEGMDGSTRSTPQALSDLPLSLVVGKSKTNRRRRHGDSRFLDITSLFDDDDDDVVVCRGFVVIDFTVVVFGRWYLTEESSVLSEASFVDRKFKSPLMGGVETYVRYCMPRGTGIRRS